MESGIDPNLINDPNPVVIAIVVSILILAFVLNCIALWKLVTMDHVRKEHEIISRNPDLWGTRPETDRSDMPVRATPFPHM